MSIIHEALKKAEQEKNYPPEQSGAGAILPGKKKTPGRTVFLGIALAVSMALLAYTRLVRKPQPVSTLTSIQATDALNVEKNPEALQRIAVRLFEEKKFEASLATWEKLTLLFPTEAHIYNNMGLALKKLGRREEAFQAYTKALALREDFPEALNNLGALYLAEGRRSEAKKNLQRAVELSPEYANPYFHLALVAEQEGNIQSASKNYAGFLERSPGLDENLKQQIEKKIETLSQ
ncbi:MAG: tetratricopeptide repeat protein [Deltaproteobacteria bacterium]|nr:tetratricopeptide repeat protein [Deltaproteobacteria bacterium]